MAVGDELTVDEWVTPRDFERELTLPKETLSVVGTTEADDTGVNDEKDLLVTLPNKNAGEPSGLLVVMPVNAWNAPPEEFCCKKNTKK